MWRCLPALVILVLVGHAYAGETSAELRTRFDAAVAAGKDADAQSAGKKLLSEFPEDPSALHVLRTFHANGWKWPRLKAPLATIRRWEQDEIDDRVEPDLRLAFVEAIEDQFPTDDVVKEGGTLYERLWCHLQARRFDETLALGKEFLRRFPDSTMVDKVRWALASAHLGRTPPDVENATKHLEWLVKTPNVRNKERAAKLLDDLRKGSTWTELADGCPRASGLGQVAVVTDLAESDPLWKALEAWRKARKAHVVRFKRGRLGDVADDLRKLGPEHVAVAVAPATVDVNFHWHLLEICRSLDGDPLPDFWFGYLVARDPTDLAALAARGLREPTEAPALATVGAPEAPGALKDLDGFLHFGHGTPTGIQGALQAAGLRDAALERGPLVVSGACFNGVLSRSFHASALQPVVSKPAEYAPHDLLVLSWVHAGAGAVIAALEGDRGEMAGSEWAHWRETAGTLGETVGWSYLQTFASLPETWGGFPRYRVGGARSTSLYDVMLRGLTSRLLVGDPVRRPLAAPTAKPSLETAATWNAGTLRATLRVAPPSGLAESQFLFMNVLTTSGMGGTGFTERRLLARIELPAEVTAPPGPPEVEVVASGRALAPARTVVRHEVWGGKRYVVLQVESGDVALSAPGTEAVFTFPASR
jgi:hypothetical protein